MSSLIAIVAYTTLGFYFRHRERIYRPRCPRGVVAVVTTVLACARARADTLLSPACDEEAGMIDNQCCELFLGDCLMGLEKLKDNSIDLTVTSPPYCIGKEYDTFDTVEGFIALNKPIIKKVWEKTKMGGSICWQIGSFTKTGIVTPLDFVVYDLFKQCAPDALLRNRIVWTFGSGLHCKQRFSGRHETILWFTKGDSYTFNLDDVRIPQKYPNKRAYKGKNKGDYSCNPLGKNPGDVWDIPNIKAGCKEKTGHPCQFPVSLVRRLIRALSPKKGIILDPFMGSGSTGEAAIIEGRAFVGMEINAHYHTIAKERIDCVQASFLDKVYDLAEASL